MDIIKKKGRKAGICDAGSPNEGCITTDISELGLLSGVRIMDAVNVLEGECIGRYEVASCRKF